MISFRTPYFERCDSFLEKITVTVEPWQNIEGVYSFTGPVSYKTSEKLCINVNLYVLMYTHE